MLVVSPHSALWGQDLPEQIVLNIYNPKDVNDKMEGVVVRIEDIPGSHKSNNQGEILIHEIDQGVIRKGKITLIQAQKEGYNTIKQVSIPIAPNKYRGNNIYFGTITMTRSLPGTLSISGRILEFVGEEVNPVQGAEVSYFPVSAEESGTNRKTTNRGLFYINIPKKELTGYQTLTIEVAKPGYKRKAVKQDMKALEGGKIYLEIILEKKETQPTKPEVPDPDSSRHVLFRSTGSLVGVTLLSTAFYSWGGGGEERYSQCRRPFLAGKTGCELYYDVYVMHTNPLDTTVYPYAFRGQNLSRDQVYETADRLYKRQQFLFGGAGVLILLYTWKDILPGLKNLPKLGHPVGGVEMELRPEPIHQIGHFAYPGLGQRNWGLGLQLRF